MKEKRETEPTPRAIVRAQRTFVVSLDLGCPIENAHKICWACGTSHGTIYRAHIQARCNEGSNDPSNYFLLCKQCHKEQPDGASPEVQRRWLLEHENECTRAMREINEFVAKIRCVARQRNAEALFDEWAESMTREQISQLMREGAQRSAGPSGITTANNAKWAVIEAFLNWLDDKRLFFGELYNGNREETQ